MDATSASNPAASEPVGFIGLGAIGTPMATRLLAHVGGLVVCDVRPEATAPLAEAGATVADTPAEVVEAGATVISLMVLDDSQVRQVTGEILDVAEAGTVVAVHSTIRPDTAEELATAGAEVGVHVVDAPVSGGVMGAHAGTLAVLLGGPHEAIELCRGPFGHFADRVVHFGPAGAGTRAKVARNLVTFASYAAAFEAMRLADAAGIDIAALGDVVRHSDAVTGGPGAVLLRDTTGPLPPDDGLRPIFGHTVVLGEKDLDLALELASELGVDLPFAELARRTLATGFGVGGGASDDASESGP